MPERAYQLWTADQPDFNWLTRVKSGRGDSGIRSPYLTVLCRACNRFGLDDVFRLGFEPPHRIRVRKGRNLLVTEDYFLCVRDGILDALNAAGVKGFASKPLPETEWHVLSVTDRRPFDASVYEPSGRKCIECGRQPQYRIIQFERQIDRPAERLTFFCTAAERGQGGFDTFVTEPLLDVLRGAGAKGAMFQRLLDAEEEERQTREPSWKPKGGVVVL